MRDADSSLPADWEERDGHGNWAVLLEHSRERHRRGEKLHPAWLPSEGSRFQERRAAK